MSFPDNEFLNGACYVLAFSEEKKVFSSGNQMAGKCYYEAM